MNTLITTDIHYVGVNDRLKHIFEGLWPLPYGVSYNSYIIRDEKIALVDTVEADFFPQFLDNVRSVIGERPVYECAVQSTEASEGVAREEHKDRGQQEDLRHDARLLSGGQQR